MPKKDAKTCWDYWECKPKIMQKCPAFNSSGPCWHVAAGYCGRVPDKRGIEKCFTCEWYNLRHTLKRRNGA